MLPKNGEPLVNEVIKADPLEPPGLSNDELLEWLFVVDVLNFCFWSDEPTLFTVKHLGKDWTGYRSMCAALAKAKARGIPVHKPEFYRAVTMKQMGEIFKSDTHVKMSLLEKRRSILHEAAKVLNQVREYIILRVYMYIIIIMSVYMHVLLFVIHRLATVSMNPQPA
jgi:hypothetical protein